MERRIAPLKDCKLCAGTGWDVEANNLFVCGVCKGHGYVVMEICKGCGLPAFEQTAQCVPFCGDEKCLMRIINVVKPHVKVVEIKRGTYTPAQMAQTLANNISRISRKLRKNKGMTDAEFNAAMDRWQDQGEIGCGGGNLYEYC